MSSEFASKVVLEILDQTAENINELMQSIAMWEAEEHSKSVADDNKEESSRESEKRVSSASSTTLVC